MLPVNPGSALGQAIGNLFEDKLEEILRKVVEDSGYVYHSECSNIEEARAFLIKRQSDPFFQN